MAKTRKTTKKAPKRAIEKKRPPGRPPAYPALLMSQNAHRFYFTTIPIDDLFPYCFVSRRDEDPLLGFQRALNDDRADDIASYLASGDGSIPTNIVLSAQDVARFRYTRRTKAIAYARQVGSFLVLDGQHRLWGYSKCSRKHRVPVAIYEGLSRAEEAKLFIDINTNQRGVPAALLLDIKQVAQLESVREELLRELFDKLAKDPKSPLAGRLSASKSVTGRISRVAFNRAIGTALKSSVLVDMESNDRYSLVRNYLNAFDAELPDKKTLLRAAFFEAIFEVFDDVVRTTHSQHRNVKQGSIQETIRPLARLELSTATGGGTRVSKTAVAALLKATLKQRVHISAEML